MSRRNWKRDKWREPLRTRERQQRKLLLQFLSVGVLMFFAGACVGTAYSEIMAEQELLAAGVQENSPQMVANGPSGNAGQDESDGLDERKETSGGDVLEDEQAGKEKETKDTKETKEIEEKLPTDWNLLLVNATHALPDDFTVELGSIGRGHQLDVRAVEDYKTMIQAARKEGVSIYVTSSYRSMEKQIELHQSKIKDFVMEGLPYLEAQELAGTMVAVPGTSEHQLGLAVDLVSSEYRGLDEKQETTKGFRWLKEHCWEYGFILRYPNGRTDITGIIYEPWHFRYVGKEAAQDITERDITLEEYLGALPVSEALED